MKYGIFTLLNAFHTQIMHSKHKVISTDGINLEHSRSGSLVHYHLKALQAGLPLQNLLLEL